MNPEGKVVYSKVTSMEKKKNYTISVESFRSGRYILNLEIESTLVVCDIHISNTASD